MAHWTNFEREQEKEIKKLIKYFSGLKEEDQNFQLALQFAWSNFRYHQFLDVNCQKIQRSLDGIHEKLMIHSDLNKATSLKKLTEEFLSLPLPNTPGTKTVSHYGILSLLLCLSESLSNTNYVERPRQKDSEKEEDFDWGKYLMEDEEIDMGPFPDTPVWSEEEEEEDVQQPLSREDSGIQVDRTPQEEQDQNKKTVPHISWKVGEPEARTWLEQHVVTQYWTAKAPQFSHSLHLHSNLAAVWDQHLCSVDPLFMPEDRTLVTESQVIRETLWLLSGVKKLFIFHLNDGKITVRNNIVVTHLTHNCLRAVLEQIAAYGQVVFGLQKFIDEVTGHNSENSQLGAISTAKKPSDPPFRTYQAFVWALYKYFIVFKEELADIEKSVINNDESITLSMVLEKLSPRLGQLKVLHKVFSTGVAEVPPDTPNVVRASHLLNTLYKAIIEYDNVGEAAEETVSLLFSLWVETVRPYLEIVDEWIVHGNLFDPAKEFIIQRSKFLSLNFNSPFYSLYYLVLISAMLNNVSGSLEEKVSRKTKPLEKPIKQHNTDFTMWFTVVLVHWLVQMQKGLQTMRNGRKQQQPVKMYPVLDAERKSFYTLFLESVQSRLCSGEDTLATYFTEQQATKQSLIKMHSIVARHLELDDIHDPLLAINFARLYLQQSDFLEKFTGAEITVDRSSESVTCQNFELTLRSCLYPHIDKRYLECCGKLMQTLKKDYNLGFWDHFLKIFFFFDYSPEFEKSYGSFSIASEVTFGFYWKNTSKSNFYESLTFNNYWNDHRVKSYFINNDFNLVVVFVPILQKAKIKYCSAKCVGVFLLSTVCVYIYYSFSDLCLVILSIYLCLFLKIFFFFLELVVAAQKSQKAEGSVFNQDSVSHFETQKEPITQQIHRMFLLRVKLMHFVNSLHNYIMTRILHSTGLEFQHQVEEAKDLDQLIKIHYRYLSTIHDRCLLREKVSFVKEAIMKVLNLVLIFSDRWQAGLGAWKIESIDKMESDFKNCHMFLVTVLTKAVCRGSFPHLESLALSLMAGMEQS
uniref:Gamma-tubulin complex component n=1 Tax=Latimeria chalumnae TaxID=7897 RepID=H3B9W7_LATCH